jgi:hypothetical protein
MMPSCVTDPGYLSRIRIFFHHGSRIQQQQKGVRKIGCLTFFVAISVTVNFFYFLPGREIIELIDKVFKYFLP